MRSLFGASNPATGPTGPHLQTYSGSYSTAQHACNGAGGTIIPISITMAQDLGIGSYAAAMDSRT